MHNLSNTLPARTPASTHNLSEKEGQFRQAVAANNKKAVLEAIQEGEIDISSCGPSGNTALHYACERRNIELINVLLGAGANSEAKNRNGLNPSDLFFKEHEVERQFLKDINAGELDRVLSTLCENKINPSFCDLQGNTALHYACMNNNIEMIRALVNSGANIEAVNSDGYSPCDVPELSEEYRLLLQDFLSSKRVLSTFNEVCKKAKSQKNTQTFNLLSFKMKASINELKPFLMQYSDNPILFRMTETKAHFEWIIDNKFFLMNCGNSSRLVASLLAETTQYSVQAVTMFPKSAPNDNHAFIVINNDLQRLACLGSLQAAYVVDPYYNQAFFSHVDDQMFLTSDAVPHNDCSSKKTSLLTRLFGNIPMGLDKQVVANLDYAEVFFHGDKAQAISGQVGVALEKEVIRLGHQLLDMISKGEITVVYGGM